VNYKWIMGNSSDCWIRSARNWRQKCDLMLPHKDALDKKDAEIAALQKQIQSSLLTSQLEKAHKVTTEDYPCGCI